MHMRVLTVLLAVALSGCLVDDPAPGVGGSNDDGSPGVLYKPETAPVASAFEVSVIPVVHLGHGLYEPTIDVSQEGTIYVSAHSTGVAVFPAPGYVSTDDGASWQTLPLAAALATPPQVQGANPLLSDEIFIVAGDDGTAWGVDINLRDYIINGWCGNGGSNCYYNPQAYDHAQVVLQASDCIIRPLKDRPWVAANNGSLFIVNNPGGGPAQIATMQVPPAVPVEIGPVVSDIQWNLCASSGGAIPGIPDLRHDGFFAMPQRQAPGGTADFHLMTGNVSDIMDVREQAIMSNSHTAGEVPGGTGPSQISNYGQAAFDAEGNLFVSALANTASGEGAEAGGIQVVVSQDDGNSWQESIFRFDAAVTAMYVDGNRNGAGMLVNWGQVNGSATDWYFGHVFVGADGVPRLYNVMRAVEGGPEASRHVQGAALGPDGRAYMVMSEVSGNDNVAMASAIGTTPMSVAIQKEGPMMPA